MNHSNCDYLYWKTALFYS